MNRPRTANRRSRLAFRSGLPTLFVWAALILSMGCGTIGQEGSDTEQTPALQFEGSIEPKYAGTWVTANKNSTLELKSSGEAKMINIAPGRGKSEVSGQWKIQGDNLLVKVNNPAGDYVSKYSAQLKADKLRLQQKASRLDVEYLRKK